MLARFQHNRSNVEKTPKVSVLKPTTARKNLLWCLRETVFEDELNSFKELKLSRRRRPSDADSPFSRSDSIWGKQIAVRRRVPAAINICTSGKQQEGFKVPAESGFPLALLVDFTIKAWFGPHLSRLNTASLQRAARLSLWLYVSASKAATMTRAAANQKRAQTHPARNTEDQLKLIFKGVLKFTSFKTRFLINKKVSTAAPQELKHQSVLPSGGHVGYWRPSSADLER